MVVVQADLAFGADPHALQQADPHVATGLKAGQIVVRSSAYTSAPLRRSC